MLASAPYALIIGGADDAEVVTVVRALAARGVPHVFLDYETTRDACFHIDHDGAFSINIDGQSLAKPAVSWTRIKINNIFSVWSDDTVDEHVRLSEWRAFTMMVSATLNDVQLYTLSAVAEVSSRPLQMIWAAQSGFVVPETSLFVGKKHAAEFVERFPSSVAKPIGFRTIPKPGGEAREYRRIFTMAVDADSVASASDAEFSTTPTLFQQRIDRGVEYRVLAFRGKAFCYRVRGVIEDKFRPDERFLYGGELNGFSIYHMQYIPVEAETELVAKTTRFLELSSLQYGAFDVIKRDGAWIFLECNAEGQWCVSAPFNLEEVGDHLAGVIEARLNSAYATESKHPRLGFGA